jgi:hypothetical protein
MQYRSHHHTEPESAFAEYLEEAERLVAELAARPAAAAMNPTVKLGAELEHLRWFPLPGEGVEA